MDTKKQNKKFNKFYILTSPILVVLITWTIAIIIFGIASNLNQSYDYFHLLVRQEGLEDRSTSASYILLTASVFSFFIGVLYANTIFKKKLTINASYQLDISLAVRNLTIAFTFTAIIAFLWIGVSIIQYGGVKAMAIAAASENSAARQAIIAGAFPGGRLVSSGFIGLIIFSTVLLSINQLQLKKHKFLVVSIFLISSLYLGLIPILSSGRINFFVALLGAFIVACYVQKKIIGFKYIFLGLLLLVTVWTGKEYFTLGHIAEETSALKQGLEGIIFYFYNDMLNVLNTIDKTDGYYHYGWYSFRFIFFFTFTDREILQVISESREHISQFVTAGEVPLLGAHIVDFGYAGFITISIIGLVVQYCYIKASSSIQYMAVYGLICASLIISSHSSYLTSQEVVYSIILVSLLTLKSRNRNVRNN